MLRLIKEKKELKMESKKIKLELKHLSAYLPYKLEGVFTVYDSIHTVTSLSLIYVNRELEYRHFKPILRPLSDLTRKELEQEGFDSHIDYLTYENKGSDWTLKAPFNMVQYLLKKHFDIYNLIESGLAIDINTLDK